jgi:ABC-type branched-subunit amino acid transport system substrate-binding protein
MLKRAFLQKSAKAIGIAAAAALLASMTVGGAHAVPEGEYFIGYSSDRTGQFSENGTAYFRGFETAVEEINRTEYMGKGAKLVVVEKEAGMTPPRHIQNMNQFIADPRIVAVTCCFFSPVVRAIKPVIEGKIPLVVTGATRADLASPPWIFNVTPLPGPNDIKAASHVVDMLGVKKAAYLVTGDNDANRLRLEGVRAAMEAKGVQTLGTVSLLSSDTDFSAAATQLINLAPDAIIINEPRPAPIAALRDRGWTGVIVTTDSMNLKTSFDKVGAALVNAPFAITFSAELPHSEVAQTFIDAFNAKYGRVPDQYSAQGYTGAWMIAQALRGMPEAPTRESLSAALADISVIERNVYGGVAVKNGQAEVKDVYIVSWTADGKIAPWEPVK